MLHTRVTTCLRYKRRQAMWKQDTHSQLSRTCIQSTSDREFPQRIWAPQHTTRHFQKSRSIANPTAGPTDEARSNCRPILARQRSRKLTPSPKVPVRPSVPMRPASTFSSPCSCRMEKVHMCLGSTVVCHRIREEISFPCNTITDHPSAS